MTYLDYLCRSRIIYKLLRLFSTNCDRVFTPTAISKEIGEHPNSLRYQLRELVKIGFLTSGDGLYQLNPDCPVIDEIRQLATQEIE